jgi:hypothetical protein
VFEQAMFSCDATASDCSGFLVHLFGDNPPQELVDLFF